MDNQNNIQDELRGMNSSLPVNNSQNPFSVPEGYFDGLAASILAKVTKEQTSSAADEIKELSPLLASISKEMPFSIPKDYFEETLGAQPFFIKEETSLVLAAIDKDLPYTVPQGYFESLSQQVLEKITQPKTKVVPLFARRWMRIAAAAVVGGIVTLGGYRYFNEPKEVQVAQQPADTTQNWVAKNERSVIQDIRKSSTKELDEFIKTVPLNPVKVGKVPSQPTDKKEVKDLLKDVSEKEIDAFLEQIPTVDEELPTID